MEQSNVIIICTDKSDSQSESYKLGKHSRYIIFRVTKVGERILLHTKPNLVSPKIVAFHASCFTPPIILA